ncbi:organic hydroperoxide resistance protein [Brevundimonas subvibrioides]|uniref:Peroxiredoxin, Ohr subfamily n=1 Tax=Brevundimonas subvibrioides (strain ATCC 15264 / DSM 4735 / LMG 14903 / NBRC 16000 / CB 81) TaxID=633149 RepID=D9QJL0_BRESC|nr:organic hydroperoxide resistance protein [Brevundimonas subvibrioides]ADL01571.1 peroxiredoxin, Ohr subfamily [Brevundimonas subvibrioides ATCC 15264]
MDVLYKAHATASGGGRAGGRSHTDDGKIDVALSVPKAMGGDDGPGTNPEQLFATGYAACYLGALRLVSGQAGTPVGPDTKVHAGIGFGKNDHGEGFNVSVDLKITDHGLDKAVIDDLIEKAHQVCPYSNATRGNVDVSLSAE